MSGLPTWIQYLQALAVPAIALLAVVIAIAQWRTAHQRAVLDLFERRMTAYSAIRESVAEVVRHGSVSDTNLLAFLRATDQAEFLFGREVKAYLNSLYSELVRHQHAKSVMTISQGDERTKAIDTKCQALRDINDFYKRFPPMLAAYAQMDQKVPFWRLKRLGDWCRSSCKTKK